MEGMAMFDETVASKNKNTPMCRENTGRKKKNKATKSANLARKTKKVAKQIRNIARKMPEAGRKSREAPEKPGNAPAKSRIQRGKGKHQPTISRRQPMFSFSQSAKPAFLPSLDQIQADFRRNFPASPAFLATIAQIQRRIGPKETAFLICLPSRFPVRSRSVRIIHSMTAATNFKFHRDPANAGRVEEAADETGYRPERLHDTLELGRASSELRKAPVPHSTLAIQHSSFAPFSNLPNQAATR